MTLSVRCEGVEEDGDIVIQSKENYKREKTFLALKFTTFMHAWNQFGYLIPATQPCKDSCGMDTTLLLSANLDHLKF